MTRIIRTRKTITVDTTQLDLLLKSISKLDSEISDRQKKREAASLAIKAEMKRLKLKEHTGAGLKAMIYRPAGRASKTVDPMAFRKLIKNDKDFYSAISVSITKAKDLLPQKQLESITTTVEGKPGEETLKIELARG